MIIQHRHAMILPDHDLTTLGSTLEKARKAITRLDSGRHIALRCRTYLEGLVTRASSLGITVMTEQGQAIPQLTTLAPDFLEMSAQEFDPESFDAWFSREHFLEV